MNAHPRCPSTWPHDRTFQCTGAMGHDGCHHFGDGAGWTDEEADESPLDSALHAVRRGSTGNGARLSADECAALLAAARRGAGDTEAIAIIGREATALIELVREARLGQDRAWALTSALGILGTSTARAAHPEND